MRLCRFRYPSSFSSRSRSSASASTLLRSSAMSCAISSAEAWPSLKMRLRVRYVRPQDATPTVTATLTAMSQIFVRMVKCRRSIYRAEAERGERDGQNRKTAAWMPKPPSREPELLRGLALVHLDEVDVGRRLRRVGRQGDGVVLPLVEAAERDRSRLHGVPAARVRDDAREDLGGAAVDRGGDRAVRRVAARVVDDDRV